LGKGNCRCPFRNSLAENHGIEPIFGEEYIQENSSSHCCSLYRGIRHMDETYV